jgi:hypothetical protein
MDPVNLTFYGLVCGTLAAFAPSLGSRATRAALGVVVGVIASALLPYLKGLMGL